MDGQTHDVGKWDMLIAHPPCTYLTSLALMKISAYHKAQGDEVGWWRS